jgi:hypothetical protein
VHWRAPSRAFAQSRRVASRRVRERNHGDAREDKKLTRMKISPSSESMITSGVSLGAWSWQGIGENRRREEAESGISAEYHGALGY